MEDGHSLVGKPGARADDADGGGPGALRELLSRRLGLRRVVAPRAHRTAGERADAALPRDARTVHAGRLTRAPRPTPALTILQVRDCAAAHAELIERGVEFFASPHERACVASRATQTATWPRWSSRPRADGP